MLCPAAVTTDEAASDGQQPDTADKCRSRQAQPRPKPGVSGKKRIRRGLARLLADDPATMAFFDALISLDDEK